MRLQLLVVVLFQAGLSEPIKTVSGYLGDSVSLPSGIYPSWSPASIEWSIFNNITLIATYRRGEAKTERFWRYKGRLSLNSTSGDLTIRNLSRDDAIKYTVNLINTNQEETISSIKVIVRQRLQQPTVQKVFILPEGGGCIVAMRCSSPDEGVVFSWQTDAAHSLVVPSPQGGTSLLLAFVNHTSGSRVQFTCTSSRSLDHASRALVQTCHDKPDPEPTPDPDYNPNPNHSRDRLLTGFLVGSALTGFPFLLLCLRVFLRNKKSQTTNVS